MPDLNSFWGFSQVWDNFGTPYGQSLRGLISVFLAIAVIESDAAVICWFSPARKYLWNPNLEQARHNWIAHSSVADEEIGGFHSSGAKYNAEFRGAHSV